MKAIAGSLGATLLIAGPAVEASPWVPEFTWTGCYLGLDIGAASRMSQTVARSLRTRLLSAAPSMERAVSWVSMRGAIGNLRPLGCWDWREITAGRSSRISQLRPIYSSMERRLGP